MENKESGPAMSRRTALGLTVGAAALTAAGPSAQALTILPSSLHARFRLSHAYAAPMVRWWWFGGAVEPDEIVREIRAMKAGGFSGFELQPVYPLALDDPKSGIRNTQWLSAKFLRSISLAAKTARTEKLRVDLTLGSGWPFGGPHITADKAAAKIVKQEIAVPAGASSIIVPELPEANLMIAAFLGRTPADAAALSITGGTVAFAPESHDRTLYLITQGRTKQTVKRPTFGSEGFVLDHLNPAAVKTHLEVVGEPLLKAFGDHPPFAIFSDSLEVYGANWTDDLLAEFNTRRGYDLTPHLLSLFFDGPASAGVRYDWGLTMAELIEARYLIPVARWARAHRTRFRSQTYGVPAVTLASNRLVHLAEGEGAEWRGFSTARWASSANHIFGHQTTSAESWTWLHKGAFRATPLDIKAEGDVLLLSGVNRFIAHGWPYSPPKVAEPGWAFYAAAVFNDHNPWWPVMADVNAYLGRLSWLLSTGQNIADVANYLPTEDAMASFKPGADATINGQMRKRIPEDLTGAVIDAGYNFDFIDGDAILAKGINYRVLILPRVERIAPEVYARIQAFVAEGGAVIVVGTPPQMAPGLMTEADGSARVKGISATLFAGPRAVVIGNEAGLDKVLLAVVAPDIDRMVPGLGFVHRRTQDNDIYFVANTTNQPVSAPLFFRVVPRSGQVWDPVTGQASAWMADEVVRLLPYESRVFVFARRLASKVSTDVSPAPVSVLRAEILSEGWQRKVGDGPVRTDDVFASWADDETTRFHSGAAVYTRTIDVTPGDLAARSIRLGFGDGAPAADSGVKGPGMSAALDAPIRDAAEVFVNGKRAGAVWCAPFEIEIAPLLKAGANTLEVRVYNTAINLLAGRPPVDYSALTARYGERFKAQNMDNLKPLPSGMLRAPELRFLG